MYDVVEGIEAGERADAAPVDVKTGGKPVSNLILATVSASALAACGGGGGGGSSPPATGSASPPPPAPPAPPPPPPVTAADASRFLGQAAMGASKADIEAVQSLGYAAWIEQQFALARPTSHFDWLMANGYADPANINTTRGFDASMWRQLIASPDQLRQRVGMALLDFLVVGIDGVNSNWRAFNMAAYVDILLDNAFGNYRTLLGQISLNTAMGSWLTFLGNRKANAQTGAQPDENYARELMQLFTIGLVPLAPDGTQSSQTETYTQADVSGLARVFTGFTYASSDASTPARYRQAMVVNAGQHETGVKSFLGNTVAGGGDALSSLNQALDAIFAHPNVAPFVSKQLIQRLVTSNPSPAYVARVSAVFANNGSGVRGDLKAVIRAILLDSEARGSAALTSSSAGKLRAPVNRFTAWARGFGATSPSEAWAIGDTSSATNRLAQSMGHSPSVFNYFRPGYAPPNTAISAQGMVGPEFQITNELSTVAYINFMQAAIQGNAVGDVRANYSDVLALSNNPQALVDEVALRLSGGQLSATTKATVRAAVESIPTTATNASQSRVYVAILLTLASPEFIVQK